MLGGSVVAVVALVAVGAVAAVVTVVPAVADGVAGDGTEAAVVVDRFGASTGDDGLEVPEPAGVFTAPSGMAAGGGTASRRPTPVRTPRKNSIEAPSTAAAAFTTLLS